MLVFLARRSKAELQLAAKLHKLRHSKENVIDRNFRYNEKIIAFCVTLIVAILG